MIKLKPTTGTLVANATIPLTQVFNTNSKLALVNNGISVRESGLVEFEGNINVTATAAGDELTIPVYDLFRVIPTNISGFANITLQLVNPATISGGVISAKFIR